MSLQIDMLRDEERRYQGPVNPKFVLISTVLAVILLGVIIGGTLMVSKLTSKSQLEMARKEWSRLEPQLKSIEAEREALKDKKTLIGAYKKKISQSIDLWSALHAIQVETPASIQLEYVALKHWDRVYMDENRGDGYNLAVSGKVAKSRDESTIIDFKRSLGQSETMNKDFQMFRLVSSEKGMDGSWQFMIRALSESE